MADYVRAIAAPRAISPCVDDMVGVVYVSVSRAEAEYKMMHKLFKSKKWEAYAVQGGLGRYFLFISSFSYQNCMFPKISSSVVRFYAICTVVFFGYFNIISLSGASGPWLLNDLRCWYFICICISNTAINAFSFCMLFGIRKAS
jgi:hypothetical protein